jgi:hypothetical protein
VAFSASGYNSYVSIFCGFCRQVFCWMDRWHGLTMEDIRAIEDKTKEELDEVRRLGLFVCYIEFLLMKATIL